LAFSFRAPSEIARTGWRVNQENRTSNNGEEEDNVKCLFGAGIMLFHRKAEGLSLAIFSVCYRKEGDRERRHGN